MKHATGKAGAMHVLRLQPGEDVRATLERWAVEHHIAAACITSAVGSLTQAHIRYANRADGIITTQDLEVVSFSGTLAENGMHLHIAVADRNGTTFGGHVLAGCFVRTTLELVIMEVEGVRMQRSKDETTTYDELDPQTIDR